MTFDTDYQAGQIALDRGEYRQAVNYLQAAVAQVQSNTQLGGEVQICLVTALEAAGQIEEATVLCQKLLRHPKVDIRQASKQMLYIMQAPELVRPEEWMIKIPDLSHLEDSNGNSGANNAPIPPPKSKARSLEERYAPIDLSQVNTQDNAFTSIALISIALISIGLWLSARG